ASARSIRTTRAPSSPRIDPMTALLSSTCRLLPPRIRVALLPILALTVALAACGRDAVTPRAAPGRELSSITVTSTAFSPGSRIPVDHTCDGDDVMPELVLSAPPQGTRSLVIVIDDPDAS